MTSNTDSTLFVYSIEHILVKGYLGSAPGSGFSLHTGMRSLDHHSRNGLWLLKGKGPASGGGHVSSAAALLDVIVRNAPEKIVGISGEKDRGALQDSVI
jgi:hypothetical protein